MKPTEEQINRVVAEMLGWSEDEKSWYAPGGIYWHKANYPPLLGVPSSLGVPWPSYYSDRNTLPQMTELLSFAQEKEYVKLMAQRFHVSVSGPEHFWPAHVVVDMIEAPMSWHVEAILRALGKWPKEWE